MTDQPVQQPDQPAPESFGLVLAAEIPKLDPDTGLPRAWAYVNHGRWVADCGVCPSALQIKPDRGVVWPDGRTWSTADRFVCQDTLCGAECVIVWPDDVAVVEDLLGQRPNPANRNWHPWETPLDLVAENIEHGVTPVKGL